MLESTVTQEDPLEIQEVLSQTADFVDVVISGTKSPAQPMVNFVLVVVRETILLRGAVCRNHQVREIHFLKPRYMQ